MKIKITKVQNILRVTRRELLQILSKEAAVIIPASTGIEAVAQGSQADNQ